ncbi:MAG TPA: hypothetical protein VHQ47_12875 [Phycisphaerae bacterium]|nr:hypothetical protein [Phycisphaerae bacterium]
MARRRPVYINHEQWRQQMLDDTSRFIEWGLRNPERVEWIPIHQVGRGQFSERVKNIFWGLVFNNAQFPE